MNQDGTFLECAIRAAFELGGIESSKIEIGFLKNDHTPNTIEQMKFLVHKYDFVHAGFMIQDSWYSCNNRDFYIDCTGRNLGGHAVIIPYYDKEGVGIQNSWSKAWGSKGFGILRWNDFLRNFIYACYIKNSFEGI